LIIERKSMGHTTKAVFRELAFRCGVLTARHRLVNRDRLTTVMFHRVLSPNDPRWVGADPEYTLSSAVFADALAFLKHHYSVVGLDEVLASAAGSALPSCPLLITLDDGWADTAEYALPQLQALALPAAVFVAAGAVGQRKAFWPERLYAAWRTGHITVAQLGARAAGMGLLPSRVEMFENSESALRRCISALQASSNIPRAQLVDVIDASSSGPAQMLNADQVRMLAQSGVAIGAHGYSHEPLTKENALEELTKARKQLEQYVSVTQSRAHGALSFPHGRYDSATVAAAVSAGYELMFTSQPTLTPLSRRRSLRDRVLGRVDMPGSAITDAGGRFSAARMATWLFPRRAQHLAIDEIEERTFTTP
jgi:peptidoglycan/xylan/chitin deacetylase (PgdA/CDA1 family)